MKENWLKIDAYQVTLSCDKCQTGLLNWDGVKHHSMGWHHKCMNEDCSNSKFIKETYYPRIDYKTVDKLVNQTVPKKYFIECYNPDYLKGLKLFDNDLFENLDEFKFALKIELDLEDSNDLIFICVWSELNLLRRRLNDFNENQFITIHLKEPIPARV